MPDAPEDSDEREGTSDEGFYGATVGQAAGEQIAATNLEDSLGRWPVKREKIFLDEVDGQEFIKRNDPSYG